MVEADHYGYSPGRYYSGLWLALVVVVGVTIALATASMTVAGIHGDLAIGWPALPLAWVGAGSLWGMGWHALRSHHGVGVEGTTLRSSGSLGERTLDLAAIRQVRTSRFLQSASYVLVVEGGGRPLFLDQCKGIGSVLAIISSRCPDIEFADGVPVLDRSVQGFHFGPPDAAGGGSR